MTKTNISKEEIAAVYPKVAEVLADALGCEVEEIKPDTPLIEGLGAESIDFLDIVYRLERTFKIKIPRGKIVEEARGDLSEADFEKDGFVSDAGMTRLRSFLGEVSEDKFNTPLKVAEIPRLFTPETFCKIVIRQQQAAAAPGEARPG